MRTHTGVESADIRNIILPGVDSVSRILQKQALICLGDLLNSYVELFIIIECLMYVTVIIRR